MAASRRNLLRAGTALMTVLSGCASRPSRSAQARVAVVGGGFAGASCAITLKQLNPALNVTLIEPKQTYIACPLSNLVIAGARPLSAQAFNYAAVAARRIQVIHKTAHDIDLEQQQIAFDDGARVGYDRLVMAPGIECHYDALPGYSEQVAQSLPHAWQAGPQTTLLRQQLQAMPDNGLVAMAIPANPYRCPPGPYERASLIAHYLQQHKPRAKLLLLDAKDSFSKQPLFRKAWQKHYPGIVEWQGASDGAAVVRVDAENRTLHTDFDAVTAQVANVIPPQRAGAIARRANLTDRSGWCPIEPTTFASTRAQNTYVIGDAAIANAMPKSAFAANAQARLCAMQIVRDLNGLTPLRAKLLNTCYSLVTPEEAISVAGVYSAGERFWDNVPGAGGASPADADQAFRAQEAQYAFAWFTTLTRSLFGP